MKPALIALTLALAVTGCDDLDKVMGRTTEGTPVTAPKPEQRIDCDLIFPGGGTRDKA